jgi:hypothetical protein
MPCAASELQIAEASDWTTVEITDRQKTLAGIAVKTWPI